MEKYLLLCLANIYQLTFILYEGTKSDLFKFKTTLCQIAYNLVFVKRRKNSTIQNFYLLLKKCHIFLKFKTRNFVSISASK